MFSVFVICYGVPTDMSTGKVQVNITVYNTYVTGVYAQRYIVYMYTSRNKKGK